MFLNNILDDMYISFVIEGHLKCTPLSILYNLLNRRIFICFLLLENLLQKCAPVMGKYFEGEFVI